MLLNVLGRSPDCRVYHENNDRAFEVFRLKDDSVVRELLAEGPEPVVVFKPLMDSQHTDRLMSLDPEARAIWAYRHYADVARSAVKLWGEDPKNVVCGVAEGRIESGGQVAMSEKLTDEARRMFDQFADSSISDLEGSLLFWYAKNTLLFNLQCQDRLLMVPYEELVRDPISGFRRVFRFADCRFRRRFVHDVHSRSVNTVPLNGANRELLDYCEELLQRLKRYVPSVGLEMNGVEED